MSTKHTVTLADGSVATRTSANRVYPYAVAVGPASKAEVIERLTKDVADNEGYLASYNEVIAYLVAGGELEVVEGYYGGATTYAKGLKPNRSSSRDEVARGERRIGLTGDSVEAILERYRKYARDTTSSIESLKTERLKVAKGPSRVGKWRVSGWSSRPELAAKERDRLAGRYPGREVVVVETAYVTK